MYGKHMILADPKTSRQPFWLLTKIKFNQWWEGGEVWCQNAVVFANTPESAKYRYTIVPNVRDKPHCLFKFAASAYCIFCSDPHAHRKVSKPVTDLELYIFIYFSYSLSLTHTHTHIHTHAHMQNRTCAHTTTPQQYETQLSRKYIPQIHCQELQTKKQ